MLERRVSNQSKFLRNETRKKKSKKINTNQAERSKE